MTAMVHTHASKAIVNEVKDCLKTISPGQNVVSTSEIRMRLRKKFPHCGMSDSGLAEVIGREAVGQGFSIHFEK
ncbi:hypothetical protein DUT91_04765 [Phyllobacterium salinisoli]|uniref:Uncharacterized protein n=1 Tax=Phyllobacterium salinisoli TaxID=1899321 RepID=A0A368K5Y5_9HYPH|nr:hypothetical protein [Phyllobacterium salinisoli]RCS24779.1 hypothetical protein DUT91_04765 [Phyllobacterium salinisoli]